jgi:hypothetical protein
MRRLMAARDRSAPGGSRDRARLARHIAIAATMASLVLTATPVAAVDHIGAGPQLVETPALADVTQLEQQVADLRAEVDALTLERDRLRDVLAVLGDLYTPLEADRLLLTELRKDVPATRGEAEAYLSRLRRLALQADPARLGPISDRLQDIAPSWLDWRDTEFLTSDEASMAFIQSGASGFESKLRELRDAILLSVANRLDGLLNTVDRVR